MRIFSPKNTMSAVFQTFKDKRKESSIIRYFHNGKKNKQIERRTFQNTCQMLDILNITRKKDFKVMKGNIKKYFDSF